MQKKKKILIGCFALLLTSCVSPGAFKADVATVRDNLNKLEKLVDNKADTDIITEKIDSFRQEINQNLLSMTKTINNSGTIHGGGGWIVLGLILMTIVFLTAIVLCIKWLFTKMTKYKGMLQLVTTAVHKSPPDVKRAIKQQVRKQASNGNKEFAIHKHNLSKECRKDGVFALDE